MKILIYCTRAKPFLFNVGDYPYDILEKEKFILRTKKGIKKT
jgi:hypothetical protein